MQTHGVAAIQNVLPSQEAEIIRRHSLKVMGQLVQLSLFFWHQGRSATPQLERHPKIASLLSNRMLLSVQEIRTDRGQRPWGVEQVRIHSTKSIDPSPPFLADQKSSSLIDSRMNVKGGSTYLIARKRARPLTLCSETPLKIMI